MADNVDNNDSIDNNLDDQIDDISLFDDFDAGDPKIDGRKPSSAGKTITKNLLSATSAFTKTAATEVADSMPKTSGLVGEFLEIKDSLNEFKQEFRENYQPTINEVKKAMYKSLPLVEKYIPKKLYDKIEKSLNDYKEEVREAQKTQEQRQSEKISRSIAEIFAAQEEIRSGERTEDRVADMVEKVTEATRHKDLKKSLISINNNLHFQSQFIKTTQTAWMKKMLELKYISVYTQRESLATLKIQVTMLETKLEELKHNNAIPDWNKWTKGDLLRKAKRDIIVGKAMKAAPSIKNYFSRVGKNVVGTAKQSTMGVLRGIKSQAALMGTAADMQQMMPDDMQGPGTGVGKFIGGLGGMFGGRRLADRLLPFIESAEDASQNVKDTAFFRGKRLKEQLEGRGSIGASFLASFLPDHTESMDVENELLTDPTQPVPLDRSMRQAVVEIIPLWLSKIAKNTRDIATGQDTEIEQYDVVTRTIKSRSEALKSAQGEVFGKEGARSQDAMIAVGKMRAGLERNIVGESAGEAQKAFDIQQKQLLKFISNSAVKNEILYPAAIRAFALGDPLDAVANRYINKTFEGIENPRAIANLITMSIYTGDGKLDKKIVRQIEAQIVNASSAKTWRDRLPQMLEAHGGYSMFKGTDLISDEGVVSEAELGSMLSDVGTEQLSSQVSQTSSSTLNRLAAREQKEQELRERFSRGRRQPPPIPNINAGYGREMTDRLVELGGMRRSSATDYELSGDMESDQERLSLFENTMKSPVTMGTTGGSLNQYRAMQSLGQELSEIKDELIRYHNLKESSDAKQLSEMIEYYNYRKTIDDKTIDAFTDTDDTTGALGSNDIFEKIQLDLQTLTETSIKNGMEMLVKLDDIVAAAELNLEMAQKRTTDLSRLTTLTDNRTPKKVFGDTDMDNIREGSYADFMKDKASKKKMMAYGIPGAIGSLAYGRRQPPPIPGQRPPEEEESGGLPGWLSWLPGVGIAGGALSLATRMSGMGRFGVNLATKAGLLKKTGLLGRYGQVGVRGLAKSGLGRVLGSSAARGTMSFGGKLLQKGLLPVLAAWEAGRGIQETALDDEKAQTSQDEFSGMQKGLAETYLNNPIMKAILTKTQRDSLTGATTGLMKTFNVDNIAKDLSEGNVLGATWEGVKGVFGAPKKVGELIGTDVNVATDWAREMKGDTNTHGLLEYLKFKGAIEDPWGWGDWKILDWEFIKGLRFQDLQRLVASNKFSEEDEGFIFKIAQRNRRARDKEAAMKKKREAAQKSVKKPQLAVTTTDSTGKVVAESYQAPSMEKKTAEVAEAARQEIAIQADKSSKEQLEETKKMVEALHMVTAKLESIDGNTGQLGDIKKDLGDNLKAASEPKVVIANTEGGNNRPKIQRSSLDITHKA